MDWLRKMFSIDLRSLALFRIALAAVLLLDLSIRAMDMSAFYTDDGVLARRVWIRLTDPLHWTLHAASGELWWQMALFILAAVFAIALMVGYRSRLMSLGSFILLASLMNRNPTLLQAGDQLLVVLCFWSIFLPLGARYSIDSALQPHYRQEPNQHRFKSDQVQSYFSVATIAVFLQVLYLYFFTAVLKTGDAWTSDFTAAYRALSLQQFATAFGDWMLQFPQLLKIATVYVLSVEFIAPFLVLLGAWHMGLRIIGLLLLASLHASFMLMMHIGLFPLIDFVALSLLIPSIFWLYLARIKSEAARSAISKVVIYYDEDCSFCLKMVLILREFLLNDEVKIVRAQTETPIFQIMESHNSWVVTDARGKPHIHWHAMAFLFCQRWPFKPIGWLMRLPPLMFLGNRLYKSVADNRALMGEISAVMFKWRPLSLRPGVTGSGLALFFLIVVTAYNVYELPGLRGSMPHLVERAAKVARLQQRWNMFAPVPLTDSFYPLVSGTLRNGDKVDVYEKTSSADFWTPPHLLYGLFNNYRWRKYLSNVDGSETNAIRALRQTHQ